MTGYVRQSAADIVPTAVVRAAPINNEFNELRDTFEQTGGHRHDGSAAEGAYVPLISDADAFNKVAVNIVDNSVDVFIEVAGAAVNNLLLLTEPLFLLPMVILTLVQTLNNSKTSTSQAQQTLTA